LKAGVKAAHCKSCMFYSTRFCRNIFVQFGGGGLKLFQISQEFVHDLRLFGMCYSASG